MPRRPATSTAPPAPARTAIAAPERPADPLPPLMTLPEGRVGPPRAVQPTRTRRRLPPHPKESGLPPATDARPDRRRVARTRSPAPPARAGRPLTQRFADVDALPKSRPARRKRHAGASRTIYQHHPSPAAPVRQRHRTASTIVGHESPHSYAAAMRRPAALDRFRMAMTPLRRIMRRTARRA